MRGGRHRGPTAEVKVRRAVDQDDVVGAGELVEGVAERRLEESPLLGRGHVDAGQVPGAGDQVEAEEPRAAAPGPR